MLMVFKKAALSHVFKALCKELAGGDSEKFDDFMRRLEYVHAHIPFEFGDQIGFHFFMSPLVTEVIEIRCVIRDGIWDFVPINKRHRKIRLVGLLVAPEGKMCTMMNRAVEMGKEMIKNRQSYTMKMKANRFIDDDAPRGGIVI